MTEISRTPAFNLKVVVQETGVKPDTLRAWERRYGLPEPKRSSGGHRLYSQRDIEIVKWLVDRREEGMSISHSVELWQKLVDEGHDPLHMDGSPVKGDIVPPMEVGSTVEEMRRTWIEACLAFDETAAEQVLTQAFALYPPAMVCLEVLQKGLAEIGMLWYENDATVQQEHFASALAIRRLNALVAAAPSPTRPARIIVACPAGEDHVFAPLLLTLMLRYEGWRVIYLGANVPTTRLETTIRRARPDLIVMTAQQLHTAATLLETARVLRDLEAPMAFGGRVFSAMSDLQQRIPGHFLGEGLQGVTEVVSDILRRQPPVPTVEPIPPHYQKAVDAYRARQAAVESRVWTILRAENNMDITYEHTANANLHLSRDILAALRLGDISLLGKEISWTEKLLLNYSMPRQMLHDYLEAYGQAVSEVLGEDGRPIVEWFTIITGEGE